MDRARLGRPPWGLSLTSISTLAEGASTRSAKEWAKVLTVYRTADVGKAGLELVTTLAPLIASAALALWAVHRGLWWGMLLTPVIGLFLMRLFMIQHDCGHGAFLPWKSANDWLGRALGVLTLTPYDFWRQAHAIHHATSGALDRRITGGIDTLTVDEYLALPPLKRLIYRGYRHPLVMFGVGPWLVFLIQHRVPYGLMRHGWRPWISALATNIGLAMLAGGLIALVGLLPFLMVYLTSVLVAASVGVWLFFVQHQYEDTYWARDPEWEFHDAALHGSSYLDLPPILRWITANIGIHHVHHLSSRIPYYRLKDVLRDQPELGATSRLSLKDSLGCARLALWDDRQRRLIAFSDLRS